MYHNNFRSFVKGRMEGRGPKYNPFLGSTTLPSPGPSTKGGGGGVRRGYSPGPGHFRGPRKNDTSHFRKTLKFRIKEARWYHCPRVRPGCPSQIKQPVVAKSLQVKFLETNNQYTGYNKLCRNMYSHHYYCPNSPVSFDRFPMVPVQLRFTWWSQT